MLSMHLIRAVEDHSDRIAASAIEEIQRNSRLKHLRSLPHAELAGWAGRILGSIASDLEPEERQKLGRRHEEMGHLRFTEGVPLHESVLGMQILKNQVIDFVRKQDQPRDMMELYSEEELERQIVHFFDFLLYHTVAGYEKGWADTQ